MLVTLVLLAVLLASAAGVAAGGVAAVAVLAAAALATRAPAAPAPIDVDVDALGRLVVLRAFLVGRRLGRDRDKVRSLAVIRLEDPALADVPPPRESLWRALFYALVLAESDRDAKAWRRAARKVGARLGPDDPFPLYQRLLEATPPRPMGDAAADRQLAARTLGVTPAEQDANRAFLWELPVGRWR